jgi:signal transduction histidine kinase/CheY-like chemotaxis protein
MGLSAELFGQLDAVGDWGLLATNTDLTVTGWNRWLEQRTGRAAADALGRPLFELFPDLVTRGLDKYFRQALAGQPAILSQRFHKFILSLPRIPGVDGGLMHQSGRIVPLLDGAAVCGTLTVIEDVTERVLREAELQSRTRQQEALAFSARSALAGHDVADLCSESVRHLASTLGVELVEALELQPGGTWARLAGTGWPASSARVFESADAPRTLAILHSATATVIGGEPDGDPRHATDDTLSAHGVTSGIAVRIPSRGLHPFGLLGAYTRSHRRFTPDEIQFAQALADIIGTAAERKRLEAELRLRVGELAVADRRKDEFLAMLAHELRNPLAPVRNAVQILRATRAEDPDVVRLAELMGRQVGQMAHMVDDLLDVSRITRGKVDLRKERVTLTDAITRAVEIARPLIEDRRHQLNVSTPSEVVVLDADPMRLTQVLGNLLNNAAKYTEEGGRIWVTGARDGVEAVVRIRDTGIGLSPDMLTSVFDLFTQENRTLDRSQGGLGIGLTLVRSLVELHGGTVRATSEGPGRGSEFVVRLPAMPTGTHAGSEAKPSRPATAPRHRLLIVDDNVDSAESLAELLGLTGHEVRTAHDGPAALIEARSFLPEVILLDIGLPRMNGYEVARRMREIPELRTAILMAMTGYGQEEDRRKSQEAGFDHHLVKPVDLSDLDRLLTSHLSLTESGG